MKTKTIYLAVEVPDGYAMHTVTLCDTYDGRARATPSYHIIGSPPAAHGGIVAPRKLMERIYRFTKCYSGANIDQINSMIGYLLDAQPLPAPTQQEADKWQTIEGAPKDGSWVVVWPPTWTDLSSCARWNEDKYAKNPRPYWSRVDDGGRVMISRGNPPTHWMPLPEAPTQAEEKQQ